MTQTYITLYFYTGFLLYTYKFPVPAISEAKTVITATPFPPPLYKNLLCQLGMSWFSYAFREKKKKTKKKREKSLVLEINC